MPAKGGLQTVGKGLQTSTAGETGKYKLNNLNFRECIKEQSLHENGQNFGLKWLDINRALHNSGKHRLGKKKIELLKAVEIPRGVAPHLCL